MCFVIVRERAIKWVLSRCKSHRDIIAPIARIRVVETAVVFCPLFVPRTWIQKIVVTISLFHGYWRAGREAEAFLMRGLSLSATASI